MRSHAVCVMVLCLLAPVGVWPRTPSPAKFEVASIKPTPVDSFGIPMSGGTYERFTEDRADLSCTVHQAIGLAFGVNTYAVEYPKRYTGIMRAFYDIVAKAPGPATKGQMQKMLRTLLIDRFKLRVQTQTRLVPGYALVIAPGGPKNLKPMPPADPDHPDASAHGMTLEQFASTYLYVEDGYFVDDNVGAMPVENETGIPGTYDLWPGPFGRAGFSPAVAPFMRRAPGSKSEPLTELLNEKLGLAQVKKNLSREFITVTHIERPTPN